MDKYYTNKTVANNCISMLLKYTNKYDRFIEPSSGDGAFVSPFPYEVVEIDLYPVRKETIKYDWLNFPVEGEDWVIFGNPPFGNRGDLSDAFIKKSLRHAKCVAFILPDVYHKERRQKIFPDNWKLPEVYKLPKDSFIHEGKTYHVPCSFFIWVDGNRYHRVKNLRESVKPKKTTNDILWDKDGEWFVFGAAPHKIIKSSDKNKNNRGYTFNASKNVVEILKAIPWKEYALSSVNGGVSWYTKKQIIDVYLENVG